MHSLPFSLILSAVLALALNCHPLRASELSKSIYPGMTELTLRDIRVIYPLPSSNRTAELCSAGMTIEALEASLDGGLYQTARNLGKLDSPPSETPTDQLSIRIMAAQRAGSTRELFQTLLEVVRRGENPSQAAEEGFKLIKDTLMGIDDELIMLEEMVKREPSPIWKLRHAAALFRADKFQRGQEIVDSVIMEFPEHGIPAVRVRAKALCKLERGDEALSEIDRFIAGDTMYAAAELWAEIWVQLQQSGATFASFTKWTQTRRDWGKIDSDIIKTAAIALYFSDQEKLLSLLTGNDSPKLTSAAGKIAAGEILLQTEHIREAIEKVLPISIESDIFGILARSIIFRGLCANPDIEIAPAQAGPDPEMFPMLPTPLSLSASFLFNDAGRNLGKGNNSTPALRLNRRLANLSVRTRLFENLLRDGNNPEPDHVRALLEDISCLGSKQEAMNLADRYIETRTGKEKWQALLLKAELLTNSGNLIEARKILEPIAAGKENNVRKSDFPARARRLFLNFTAAKGDHAEALSFLNRLIEINPDDPDNYEALASYLQSNSLLDDLNKVYTRAARKFKTRQWYDKLARVLLRIRKGNDLRKLISEALPILDSENTALFLESNLYYPSINSSSTERNFFKSVHLRAMKRFPLDLKIAGRYLTFLKTFEKTEYLKFLYRYFAVFRRAREELLDHICSEDTEKNLFSLTAEAEKGNMPAMDLLASVLIRLSRFESALPVLKKVVQNNPERENLLLLTRISTSLGYCSQSASIMENLWSCNLDSFEFLETAGEAQAIAHRMDRAFETWKKWTERYPGNPDAYRAVAGILWDFKKTSLARQILDEGRKKLGRATLFGDFMASIEVEENNSSGAMNEAFNLMALNKESMSQSLGLAILDTLFPYSEKQSDPPESLIKCLNDFHNTYSEDHSSLWNGLEKWLSSRDQSCFAAELALEWKQMIQSPFTMERAERIFQRLHNPEKAYQCRLRMVELSGETTSNLLASAALLVNMNKLDQASNLIMNILKKHQYRFGSITALGNILKKQDRLNEMISKLENIGEDSKPLQKNEWRQTAELLRENKLYSQALLAAEKAATPPLDSHGNLDTESATLLLETSFEAEKSEVFEKWALVALKDIREFSRSHSVSPEWNNFEVRSLLAKASLKKKASRDTQAQYIEMINLRPYDENLICMAFEYARKNRQLNSLLKYYEDLTSTSARNPKWHRVVYLLSMAGGNRERALKAALDLVMVEPEDQHGPLWCWYRLDEAGRSREGLDILEKHFNREGMPLSMISLLARAISRTHGREAVLPWIKNNIKLQNPPWKFITASIRALTECGLTSQAAEMSLENLNPEMGEKLTDICSRDFLLASTDACLKSGRTAALLKSLLEVSSKLNSIASKIDGYAKNRLSRAENQITIFACSTLPSMALSRVDRETGLTLTGIIKNKISDLLTQNRIYEAIELCALPGKNGYPQTTLDSLKLIAPFATRGNTFKWPVQKAIGSEIRRIAIAGLKEMTLSMLGIWRHWTDAENYHDLAAEVTTITGLETERLEHLLYLVRSSGKIETGKNSFSGSPKSQKESHYLPELLKTAAILNRTDIIENLRNNSGALGLQLLNLEFDEGKLKSALKILDSGLPGFPELWKKIRKAEILGVLADQENMTETLLLFRELLDLHRLGNKVYVEKWQAEDNDQNQKVVINESKSIQGDDWFRLATHFAHFLSRMREPGKMIHAITENAPTSWNAYIRTSRILEMGNHLEDALEWAEKAMTFPDGRIPGATSAASLMIKMGRTDDAVALLRKNIPEKCEHSSTLKTHFSSHSIASLIETCRHAGKDMEARDIMEDLINCMICRNCLEEGWPELNRTISMVAGLNNEYIRPFISRFISSANDLSQLFKIADLTSMPSEFRCELNFRAVEIMLEKYEKDANHTDKDFMPELIGRASQAGALQLMKDMNSASAERVLKITEKLIELSGRTEPRNLQIMDNLDLIHFLALKTLSREKAMAFVEKRFPTPEGQREKLAFLRKTGETEMAMRTAGEIYSREISLNPSNHSMMLEMTSNLLLSGETAEAFDLMTQHLNQWNDNPEISSRTGTRFLDLGYPSQGAELLRKSLLARPWDQKTRVDLSASLLVMGQTLEGQMIICEGLSKGYSTLESVAQLAERIISLDKGRSENSAAKWNFDTIASLFNDDIVSSTPLKSENVNILFKLTAAAISGNPTIISESMQVFLANLEKMAPCLKKTGLITGSTALTSLPLDSADGTAFSEQCLLHGWDSGNARAWMIMKRSGNADAVLATVNCSDTHEETAPYLERLISTPWLGRVSGILIEALQNKDRQWEADILTAKLRELKNLSTPPTFKTLLEEIAGIQSQTVPAIQQNIQKSKKIHFRIGHGMVDPLEIF